MYDLVLRGGDVIDGTGAARRRADVAIVGDRIVAIGQVPGDARRTIDVSHHVVTPGFVDVHTHYDAHVFWDPTTPSALHGVTTALAGNCGFSIAPLTADPSDSDFVLRMLARAEGIPPDVLRAGVPWTWRSTADYLDHAARQLGINVGLLVGHSTLRRAVMGPRATAGVASPDDVAAMQRLLRAGLEAGALGFSSSHAATHDDGDRHPVPSRAADLDELLALAATTGEVDGTSLQFIAVNEVIPFEPAHLELLTGMSQRARRPLNWNTLHVTASTLERSLRKLAASDHARAHDAKVVALTMPVGLGVRLNFHSGFMYDAVDGWGEAMRAPLPRRLAWFRDPALRAQLAAAAAAETRFRALVAWDDKVIFDTFSPQNDDYRGHALGDIADAEGRDPFDVLCDIVVADELRTTFGQEARLGSADDWRAKARLLTDPRTVIGGSDAGAHVDMIADFAYPTRLIAQAVRAHGVLSLEAVIHQLTQRPAELYGLRHRGNLAEGWYADFVVLDETLVDAATAEIRYDLPHHAGRLHADAIGIAYVGVNGTIVVDHGTPTGACPGTLLRAGTDTTTPAMD